MKQILSLMSLALCVLCASARLSSAAATNLPAASAVAVMVNPTTGVIVAPTNFASANGLGGGGTNVPSLQQIFDTHDPVVVNVDPEIGYRFGKNEFLIISTDTNGVPSGIQFTPTWGWEFVGNLRFDLWGGIYMDGGDIDMGGGSIYNVGTNTITFTDGTTLKPSTIVTRSTVTQAVETAVAALDTYPVLRIELGAAWTDFELKASTNNFQTYVYHIKTTGLASTNCGDTNVWVYYTDDYAPDPRRWIRATNQTAILSQLYNPTNSRVDFAIVCPSHDTDLPWATWMAKTNSKLVWSYVRIDGANHEKNASGNGAHFNPALPVEWRKTRYSP